MTQAQPEKDADAGSAVDVNKETDTNTETGKCNGTIGSLLVSDLTEKAAESKTNNTSCGNRKLGAGIRGIV